jgi:hypothetical protein
VGQKAPADDVAVKATATKAEKLELVNFMIGRFSMGTEVSNQRARRSWDQGGKWR